MTSKPERKLVRVGIIGLSASATSNWAADAHLPSLLSDRGRRLFELVALCNSSLEAAKRAIQHFKLPATTKAYGDVQTLAGDADVDLVICATRVDKHYDHIVPSIKAGKDIFVEWPVTANSQDVKRLVELGTQHNVRIAVGLQGRSVPPALAFKRTLEEQTLGKLLGTELHLAGGVWKDPDAYLSGWEYFADKKVGGNHITILLGHALDPVLSVVGQLVPGSTSSYTQVQFDKVKVVSQEGTVIETVGNDVPDLLSVHGKLQPSEFAVDGATLTVEYRRAWPLPGESALRWIINCERGIAQVDAIAWPGIKADAYNGPVTIRLRHNGSDEIKEIPWSRPQEYANIPRRAIDTLASLEAFATDDDKNWVNISEAVSITEMLEAWIDGKSW